MAIRKIQTIGIALIIILTFILAGCDQAADSTSEGRYQYTSYDSAGTALVNGWFTMNFTDADTFTGEWHFMPIDNPENIGPQTGDGELQGVLREGSVSIELNPQYRDNNIELSGVFTEDHMSGTWIWSSLSGPTSQGTFEAVKE